MNGEATNTSVNTIEYNPELAISSVQDMVSIDPNRFTRVEVDNYQLYIENSPDRREMADPRIENVFGKTRFFGIEHVASKFPGQDALQETKSSIFSVTSQSSWNRIWDFDFTQEEYSIALVGMANLLKKDVHKGSREMISTLPEGEVVRILFIPLDLNGQKDGHGMALRNVLEQRKAVLQK